MHSIKIHEIYQSIQGESSYSGYPCVFVRTTGCHLRCRWCDTTHAFEEGEEKSIEAIMQEVRAFGCQKVELTGGEPLLQGASFLLIAALLNEGYFVLVETSGSIAINRVDPRAVIVLDIKCPGSGMQAYVIWENLRYLKKKDEVKFVIADHADYLWAKGVLVNHPELKHKIVHFSPAFGEIDPRQLAEWILEDRLPVRLQLQLHKYIWDPAMKGV